MNWKIPAAAATAVLVLGAISPARAANDESFVKTAVQGDVSEMTLGKLAAGRGSSDGVRAYGRMLAQDHAQGRDQALQVARTVGAHPPQKPTGEADREYRKLQGLSGAAFDREFVRYMVHDHRRDIQDFEKQAAKRGPAASLARDGLPMLHKHLDVALKLSREQAGRG